MIVKHKYRAGGSSQHSNRRRYRYGGAGAFSNLLGRTFMRDNVQKLINSVSKSKLTQKAVDAVVDGSANALKTATQKGIENIINKKKKNQRNIQAAIEELTTGKGVVYD